MFLPTRLIATIGLPFSGKSTLSQELADLLPAERIELDRVLGEEAGAYDQAPRAWIERYRRAHARIEDLLAAGEPVVFDSVNHTRRQRDRLRSLAARQGSSVRFVWMDTPLDVIRARMARNLVAPTRPNLTSAQFDEIARGFEPPDDEADVLVYDGTIPLHRWAAELADALSLGDGLRTDGGLAFRRC